MSKKPDGERCNGCHHLMRLHYLRRKGTSCGRCHDDDSIGTHWSDKTGRACKGCGHYQALHFISGICRLVGCQCKRFS